MQYRTMLERCAVLFPLRRRTVNGGVESVEGTLKGVVCGPYGTRVSGAQVTAANRRIAHTVFTDHTGRFEIPDLLAGWYQIYVQSTGFLSWERSAVRISAGRETTLEVPLSVAMLGTSLPKVKSRLCD